jgi:hypothetical protein
MENINYKDTATFRRMLNEYDFEIVNEYKFSDSVKNKFKMLRLTNKKCYYNKLFFDFNSAIGISSDYINREHDKFLFNIKHFFDEVPGYKVFDCQYVDNLYDFEKMMKTFLYYYVKYVTIDVNIKYFNKIPYDVFGDYNHHVKDYELITKYVNNVISKTLDDTEYIKLMIDYNFNMNYFPSVIKARDIKIIINLIL